MSTKGTKLTLKRNKKLDCLVHAETGLVFKSATEKFVTGRVVNDELVELDEEAQQLCEEHGFKIDPELVSEDNPEAEEETEETPKEPVKEEKKKSVSVEEVPKEPVGKKSSKKGVEKLPDVLEQYNVILQRHTKELQDFVVGRQSEAQSDKDRLLALEKELKEAVQSKTELTDKVSSLTKDLEETKKKLKGVLAAMQGDL